jgi:hypothetical protein
MHPLCRIAAAIGNEPDAGRRTELDRLAEQVFGKDAWDPVAGAVAADMPPPEPTGPVRYNEVSAMDWYTALHTEPVLSGTDPTGRAIVLALDELLFG